MVCVSRRSAYRVLVGKPIERRHLEDVELDKIIIFREMLNK